MPIIQVEDLKREEKAKVIVSAAYDFQKVKEGMATSFKKEKSFF